MVRISEIGLVHNSSAFMSVEGQQALCWTAFSPRTKSLFLTDPLTNLVTEARVESRSKIPSAIILDQYYVPGQPLDASVAHLQNEDVLFVLAPESMAIQVLPILGVGHIKHTQEYAPQLGVPFGRIAVGLANYVIPWPSSASSLNPLTQLPQLFQFN